jgi:hypothetical protein
MHVPQLTQQDLVHAVSQIAANPLMLVPVTRLGEDAMLTILDSSRYAALGEELNFWQLMVRRVFSMRPVTCC